MGIACREHSCNVLQDLLSKAIVKVSDGSTVNKVLQRMGEISNRGQSGEWERHTRIIRIPVRLTHSGSMNDLRILKRAVRRIDYKAS